MPTPEKIMILMELCGKQDIILFIKKEGEENFIKRDDHENGKRLVVNFVDYEDDSFESLIDQKITELKLSL